MHETTASLSLEAKSCIAEYVDVPFAQAYRALIWLLQFTNTHVTAKKKGLTISRKSLIQFCILVGGTGIEPVTPAV